MGLRVDKSRDINGRKLGEKKTKHRMWKRG